MFPSVLARYNFVLPIANPMGLTSFLFFILYSSKRSVIRTIFPLFFSITYKYPSSETVKIANTSEVSSQHSSKLP